MGNLVVWNLYGRLQYLFRSTATVVANRNTSLIQIHKSGQDFYRPQQYLRKGNVFTGVCLFVHHPGADTPLGRHPPPRQTLRRQTLPLSSSRHCSGRHASYWNVFLLKFYSQEGHLFVWWHFPPLQSQGEHCNFSSFNFRWNRFSFHHKQNVIS